MLMCTPICFPWRAKDVVQCKIHPQSSYGFVMFLNLCPKQCRCCVFLMKLMAMYTLPLQNNVSRVHPGVLTTQNLITSALFVYEVTA
jgi:hypothetical protein